MKITYTKSRPVKLFIDVNETDCFILPNEDGVFVNRICMKIGARWCGGGLDFNVVSLTNGELTWVDDDEEIYPLDAELKVNDFMSS